MKILVLQTCDGDHYKPFLDFSEPIHRAFCNKYGYDYLRWDGIKKCPPDDHCPAFSAWNRIYLLRDAMNAGYDWCFYMDSDCIIHTQKPIDEYLKQEFAVVACRGISDDDDNYWEINNGVAFYNLKHPKMSYILDNWEEQFNDYLSNIKDHKHTIQDWIDIKQVFSDQQCLQKILKENRGLCYVYKGKQANEFNYHNGKWLTQVLRHPGSTVKQRLEIMMTELKPTDHIKRFTEIYEKCVWGDNKADGYKGSSGSGSALINNLKFCEEFTKFVMEKNINSVADLGCGDWIWGATYFPALPVEYHGYDAYLDIIKHNKKNYPLFNFYHLDFLKYIESVKSVDCLLLKDVCIHWTNLEIKDFLNTVILLGKWKYVVMVHCSYGANEEDIITGQWRPLSYQKYPLNSYKLIPLKHYSIIDDKKNIKEMCYLPVMR